MKRKLFSQDEAIEFIRRQQGKRTVYEYATALGVSHVLLRQFYKGRALPGPKLGFRKIVTKSFQFERIARSGNGASRIV